MTLIKCLAPKRCNASRDHNNEFRYGNKILRHALNIYLMGSMGVVAGS